MVANLMKLVLYTHGLKLLASSVKEFPKSEELKGERQCFLQTFSYAIET